MFFLKNKKQKRGFSIVELMVVVAIIGVITSISVPIYSSYRSNARKSIYKSDLSSMQKGILAFGAETGNFCRRKTQPNEISLATIGMASVFSSEMYGYKAKDENFIGISRFAPPCRLSNITSNGEYDVGTVRNNLFTFHDVPSANTSQHEEHLKKFLSFGSIGGDRHTQCSINGRAFKAGVYGKSTRKKYAGFNIDEKGILQDGERENTAVLRIILCSNNL